MNSSGQLEFIIHFIFVAGPVAIPYRCGINVCYKLAFKLTTLELSEIVQLNFKFISLNG